MKRKVGLCFLDPHRQTAQALAGMLGDVADDVVYLDFDDDERVVAYCPFAGVPVEDYGRMAGDFGQIFGPLLGTEGYRRLEHHLANGMFGLFVLGRNVARLPVLYERSSDGERLRSQIIATVQHEPVLRFWRDEYPSIPPSTFAPIHNRFSGLQLDDRTFRTFNQDTNKVDFRSFMEEGKIVIVALPASWEAARILGGFMIGQVKHLALRRPPTAPKFFLIVDEFHRFEGAAFHEILDQTTKGRLSLWLAHQNTSQVPTALCKTIQGIDTFAFGMNAADAKLYSNIFGGKVSAETLSNLKTGAVYARVGGDLANFDCPLPAESDPSVAERIISASRERYYTPAAGAPAPVGRAARVIDTF